jgi:tetratricopeptide (TPR) repeat protein
MKIRFFLLLLIYSLNIFSCDITHKATYEELKSKVDKYSFEGDNEKVIFYGKKALLINSTDPGMHFQLALTYYDMWSDSRKLAEKKRLKRDVLNSKHSRPHTREGLLKELEEFGLRNDYFDMSIHELEEALKYEPTNWTALQFMAEQYYRVYDYEKAIESYKKLVEIHPENEQRAYYFIGASYARLGDYLSAETYLNKAIEENPKDDYSHYYLGLVYKAQGDMEGALLMFNKLKEMNSPHADSLKSPNAVKELTGDYR